MEYTTIEEKLAALLLANQGSYLSGEAISRGLGVTRSTVWKGMDRLRQAGWELESGACSVSRTLSPPR